MLKEPQLFLFWHKYWLKYINVTKLVAFANLFDMNTVCKTKPKYTATKKHTGILNESVQYTKRDIIFCDARVSGCAGTIRENANFEARLPAKGVNVFSRCAPLVL